MGWGWALIWVWLGGRGGGRLFKAGRLLTFSAFRMGAYSRWALIRGWALIRINTVCKKLIWFGKQTEAQSYNQLQRCLRHWTLLEFKWPVQDVGFVVPASCLVKVTHKKLWETTVNGGEEEYGCFYLTYVWISLIWSKNDIFCSESRHFSWLLQVEVCICLQHVVSSQLQIVLQWQRTETRKCLWIEKFGNVGFTWLRKWCQFRQPMTKC